MDPSTSNTQHTYIGNEINFPNMPEMNPFDYPKMMMTTPNRSGEPNGPLLEALTPPSGDESGQFDVNHHFSRMPDPLVDYKHFASLPPNYLPYHPLTQKLETSPFQMVPEGCLKPEETAQPEVEDEREEGGGPIRGPKKVETVQGRLNIVNSQKTYNVTREEILRRLTGVEKMNASTLSAMLRKSKVKNGGSDLRSQMAKWDIKVEVNKRSSIKTNSFTSLVEEESVQLAQDLDTLVYKNFPFDALAAKLVNNTNPEELFSLRDQFTIAQESMRKIGEILESTKIPLGSVMKEEIKETGPFQDGMEKMSELTHGFAIQNSRTWSREYFGLFKKTADMADNQIKNLQHMVHLQQQPWAPMMVPPGMQNHVQNEEVHHEMWNQNQFQQYPGNPNQ